MTHILRDSMTIRRWTVLALVSCASNALASPADTYGLLGRGVATAGVQTALADDAASAYYNPAGFGLGAAAGKTSVQVGYAFGAPAFSVDRTTKPESESQYKTELPGYQGYASVAALFPLGGMLENKAALGLTMYMPQDKLARVESLDPKSPQWTRYQSSLDRLVLSVGAGAKLGKYVAVGAGAQVLAGLDGRVFFDIELFDKRVDRRDLSFALKNSISPVAGVTVTPHEKVRVAFAFRGSNELRVNQPNTIVLGDIGTLQLDVSGVVHYTPLELSTGVSFAPTKNLVLAADVKYQRWSVAPNPAMQVKVGITGEIPEGLGLDKALAMQSVDGETGFRDIAVVGVAAEYTFKDDVTKIRGGYSFRPSYVPDQNQQTNFLDNNTHLLGAGLTFQFSDPTQVFTKPIKVDLAAQAQYLASRTVTKKQPADVVGSYSFGGIAVAGNVALRYEF